MGRISDIVPPLYYGGKNDVVKFLDALDIEVSAIEKKIQGITDLIDVDRCPDDKLPYLAAMTNCPLVGADPASWRRQIRNWPWLLKLKGTERSFDLYLNSIGAEDHRIPTYFRDAEGNYIEEKPPGEPFLDESGIWRNIRTHYFGLEVTLHDHTYLRWQEWHKDFVERVSYWFNYFKPFHSELLRWDTYVRVEEALDIAVGAATAQGEHQEVALALTSEGISNMALNIGAATAQGKHQEVALAQSSGKAGGALSFGHAVSCGISLEIGLA